jgi:uncharacterized membrane protein YjjB (DUF3815 family)
MLSTAFFAFGCTFAFAILFNSPKRLIPATAAAGALGWLGYEALLGWGTSVLMASFAGALIVGIAGEILARLYKEPATLFVIPGIIPLVPGYGLYETMLRIIEKEYAAAGAVGFEAVLGAISIAFGLVLSLSTFRLLTKKDPDHVDET